MRTKTTNKLQSAYFGSATKSQFSTSWIAGVGVEQAIVGGFHVFGEMTYAWTPDQTVVLGSITGKVSNASALAMSLGALYQF